jgi:hypothetical protein
MYKVLFFNTQSCFGFSIEFKTRDAALDACREFIKMHANNVAVPFDDRSDAKKLDEATRVK